MNFAFFPYFVVVVVVGRKRRNRESKQKCRRAIYGHIEAEEHIRVSSVFNIITENKEQNEMGKA